MTPPRDTPPVLLLDRTTVAELLSLDDCIAAVEGCFAAHARGESLAPGLLHGDGVGGEFHIKAGGLRVPEPYFACKINGGFFGNRSRNGLPNIQGLIQLSSASTGQPLAVMESGRITLLRTGAATAVAAKSLARKNARSALVVGSGTQAAVQLRALARVLNLERAFVWGRDRQKAADLARRMSQELRLSVSEVGDLADTARSCDVIVTCTPSRRWILGRDMVGPGAFVAAVGADSPDKQEIEPALLAHAAVVTDLTAQCAEVGDLHHAIAAGLMTEKDVRAELGEVIIGKAPGRINDQEITVFDSTGTALQDVAAAVRVYELALERGRGTRFAFWG